MTVTLDIQEDKLALFWEFVREQNIEKEADDLKLIERAQILAMLNQDNDPVLSATESWETVKAKML
jgi:hypothetical protein